MKTAEMEKLKMETEKLMAKMAAENIRDEAKRSKKKYKPEAVATEAAFLKRWSKGKPIVRQTADSTFWAAGKWMTKLDWGMAQAIVNAGLATVHGAPTDAGCTLQMKP